MRRPAACPQTAPIRATTTNLETPFPIRRTGVLWLLAFLALWGAADARADRVVPSAEVVTRVVLRSGLGTYGRDVGSLRPGDSAAQYYGRHFQNESCSAARPRHDLVPRSDPRT